MPMRLSQFQCLGRKVRRIANWRWNAITLGSLRNVGLMSPNCRAAYPCKPLSVKVSTYDGEVVILECRLKMSLECHGSEEAN